MTTAAGVELMETVMKMVSPKGFAPDDHGDAAKPLTREGLREMQADPRYGQDETYTAEVSRKWDQFAQQLERGKR